MLEILLGVKRSLLRCHTASIGDRLHNNDNSHRKAACRLMTIAHKLEKVSRLREQYVEGWLNTMIMLNIPICIHMQHMWYSVLISTPLKSACFIKSRIQQTTGGVGLKALL